MIATKARTAVITGASSGIGLAAAKALAAQGWQVIGVGRNPERSRTAGEAIAAAASGAPSAMLCGDFAEFADVERVAKEIGALTDRIDTLFLNAGGLGSERKITSEGHEATFAGNHLGHFLLTGRLLPLLRATAAATPAGTVRVVSTSSAGHAVAQGFDWNDLQMMDNFAMMPAYCQAKLANILFTRELARRVAPDGIIAHAMHPGLVGSNFSTHGDDQLRGYFAAHSERAITPEFAAETLVWLATAAEPGESSGGYFHDLAPAETAPQGRDDAMAARLWEESAKLVPQAGF